MTAPAPEVLTVDEAAALLRVSPDVVYRLALAGELPARRRVARRMTPTVAALYVDPRGPYANRPDIDAWDEARDARLYAGPHRVVGHPPCARWGRYASGGPSHHGRFTPGDDGGCFAACLAAVRTWGGVLEHPAGSLAWKAHGLRWPPRSGGWILADDCGGWTCCVDQNHYGHPAAKATWLYAAVVRSLPSLTWGRGRAVRAVLDRTGKDTVSRKARRDAQRARGILLLSARARLLTPEPFAELLLQIARSATG